ncbi:uncharacterized protein LOC110973673 [Acanthaster planci]|uniref:Uncharacterized protein LOC110973673 n=1 Tax=Acanthaster planci TaxID=133434 RepID=A0A8B7XHT3_ACAPL|nr:uncharacterized protein LOC110973673 [Acanthaster planci]
MTTSLFLPPCGYHQVFACAVGILMLLIRTGDATEYMDQNCGGTIDAGRSGDKLDSQIDYYYGDLIDCTVTITADFNRRILLTFSQVDIDGGLGCNSDYLEVYEGSSTLFRSADLGVICGTSAGNIVSLTNTITLRFKTDYSGSGTGFVLSYTSFESPTFSTCGADEFKCDNNRCIDVSLRFNSYDNCGDNSDETFSTSINVEDTVHKTVGLAIGILVAIIIAAIVGVVLVCVCVGCICYHCCCKKRQPQQPSYQVVSQTPQQQPPMAMQPTGQSSQPASYGQPGAYPAGQQAYPANQPAYPAGQPAYPAGQPGLSPTAPPAYPAVQPAYPPGQPTAYSGEKV